MADIFSFNDATALLSQKHVMFLGDSNIRAQYKDLVWLLNKNTLIQESCLKKKLEGTFLGDKLVSNGKLNRGRDFKEVREYDDSCTRVDFMFIPRCYNRDIEELFKGIKNGYKPTPDVIVMNSCMWDLTRWGPNGVSMYKDNMVKLMRLMSQTLPKETLVIWTTALPAAAHVRGGLIIKQIQCMEPLLRFVVMEANTFARDVVAKHGFDLLDLHYYNRMQIHRRAKDGIHFGPVPVRFMTNLLLTHIALSWDCKLPGKVDSILLQKTIARNCNPKEVPVKLPTTKVFSRISPKSPDKCRPQRNTQSLSIKITCGGDRGRQCTMTGGQVTSSVPLDSRPILRRLGNHPVNQNGPSNSMDSRPILQRLGNQPCEQSGSSNPMDFRPILSRLWNQPSDQTGTYEPTNQQAGPIRNRNKKKKRRNNFYQGSDYYHY